MTDGRLGLRLTRPPLPANARSKVSRLPGFLVSPAFEELRRFVCLAEAIQRQSPSLSVRALVLRRIARPRRSQHDAGAPVHVADAGQSIIIDDGTARMRVNVTPEVVQVCRRRDRSGVLRAPHAWLTLRTRARAEPVRQRRAGVSGACAFIPTSSATFASDTSAGWVDILLRCIG